MDELSIITFYQTIEDATSLLNKGRAGEALGKFKTALNISLSLKNIQEVIPSRDLAGLHINIGIIYNILERWEDAIQQFDLAESYEKGLVEVYFNRGLSYYNLKKYDLAVAEFSKAIEFDPETADAFCNRGLCHYYSGQFKQSIEDLSEAIRLNPDDSEFYYSRAISYAADHIYPKALKDLHRVIKAIPDHAQALLLTGNIYLDLKDFNQARDTFLKALHTDDDNAQIFEKIGYCEYMLNLPR